MKFELCSTGSFSSNHKKLFQDKVFIYGFTWFDWFFVVTVNIIPAAKLNIF